MEGALHNPGRIPLQVAIDRCVFLRLRPSVSLRFGFGARSQFRAFRELCVWTLAVRWQC
jgi:hypothetical protein